MTECFFCLLHQYCLTLWFNQANFRVMDGNFSSFLFNQIHIHVIERFVASFVVGSLVIRAGSHNGRNLSVKTRTNDTDLNQIRQTVFVGIHARFHIDHFADCIMASKSRKTFTIEIVVGIVFRNQTVAH